jgi:hypothetical protein
MMTKRPNGHGGQILTETAYYNGAWKVKVLVWERNTFTNKFCWVVKVQKKFTTKEGAEMFAEKYECGLLTHWAF